MIFLRRKKPVQRPYLRRASGPSEELREFWFRQFRRHFEAEKQGINPALLVYRWLSLDAMTWNDRGPRVEIDLNDQVRHFLDDANIREKDPAYATQQRQGVQKWLDAH